MKKKKRKRTKALGKMNADKALQQAVQYYQMGQAALNQNDSEGAVAAFRKALSYKPDWAEANNFLGVALDQQGRSSAAIDCFKRALEYLPGYAAAYCNMGTALNNRGMVSAAMDAYQTAIQIAPDLAEAHNNLGNIYQNKGALTEAISLYRSAVDIKPGFADAFNNMGNAYKDQGRLEQALACYGNALKTLPGYAAAHSNMLFAMNCLGGVDAADVFNAHRNWEPAHGAPPPPVSSWPGEHSPDRRLRIGYVSGDFCRHSVAYFIEPVLAAHNHLEFEVFCYANHVRADHVTRRLKKYADHWRPISGLPDPLAFDLIREDQIDLLIDLSGHTARNRLPLFARKPAPIQITYLGYPNTTGLTQMDYRITDAWADPPGHSEALHSETLIRLPRGFLCYRPDEEAPDIRKADRAENGRVVFGSFNYAAKITPGSVALWSKILHQVPDSRLLLKSKSFSDAGAKQHLLSCFEKNGVPANRIDFSGFLPAKHHLQLYNQVDIALDTFPYNGTTTTCEALWMGTPVITLAGDRHAARVGVSLLSNLGLPELIAQTGDDYVQKAIALAGDKACLQSIQSQLRSMMAQSVLVDATGFARALEAEYRRIWRAWCSSRSTDAAGAEGLK